MRYTKWCHGCLNATKPETCDNCTYPDSLMYPLNFTPISIGGTRVKIDKVTVYDPNEENPYKAKNNPVTNPSHYTRGGIECIDAIKSATEGLAGFESYCVGNAIKYLWRWKFKNGRQDIEKAMEYCKILIENMEG